MDDHWSNMPADFKPIKNIIETHNVLKELDTELKLDMLLIMDNFKKTTTNQDTIAQNTERIAAINGSKWIILIIIYTFNLID